MPFTSGHTDVVVCNMALGIVGQRQTITALADTTAEARACTTFYARTRDWLLEKYDWSFTEAWVTLTESEEERNGWTYTYEEPTNCMRIRYLWNGDREPQALDVRPTFHRILNDDADGFLIACDVEDAEAVYSRHITTPTMWTAGFVDALAWQLAIKLALVLPVKPQLAMAIQNGAAASLRAAVAFDFNQGQPDAVPEGGSVRAR